MPQVHLVRRGRTFYFRAAVPKRLVAIVGSQEIKVSLRTTDTMSARMRARIMSNALESLFRSIKSMNGASSEGFKQQVRGLFQGLINKSWETALLLPTDSGADLGEEIASLQASHAEYRQRLANQQFSPFVQYEAAELLESANPGAPKPDLETLRLASNAVLRARLENIRILIAQLQGNYGDVAPHDPLFAGMLATELPPIPGEAPAKKQLEPTLSECADKFINFKSGDWVKKTAGDIKRTLNLASAVIGPEKPMRSIDTEDVKKMRDALAKLPANFMKASNNTGLHAKDALSADIPGAKLSIKTQQKYLFMFKSLLNWCLDEGFIDKIPGPGIKVAGVGKLDPADQRHPYSDDQLTRIFSSPLYTGHEDKTSRLKPGTTITRDGKFWVPLIALFTGMRLSEIVQLLRTDIKNDDGIFYFDVTKGDDKTLKTSGSKRKIPVHRQLIELGLLVFVSELKGPGRIFEDIKKGSDGSYSSIYSKWWGHYSTKTGFKVAKTAFHSFRHNFLDALRSAGQPQYVNEALLGHSNSSVHSKYGSGPSSAQLKEAVDKVSYAVDFGSLAVAK